jgi:hypothetical protein
MDPEMMARGILGTMAGLAIAGLYHQGRIGVQGAPPRSVGDKEAMYAQKSEPMSILLGQQDAGGQWVPLSRLDPLGIPFGLAISAIEAQDTEQGTQAAVEFVRQMMRMGLEKGYLTTIGDLFDLASDYGDAERVNRFLVRQLGGLQPYSGLTRQVATQRDPRVVIPETPQEQFMSQIPGLRERLPAKRTPLGEEARYAEPALGPILGVPGTPLAFRPAETDPVYRELLRLGIRPAGNRETRERRGNEEVERRMREYMASPGYARSSDEARKRRFRQILSGE